MFVYKKSLTGHKVPKAVKEIKRRIGSLAVYLNLVYDVCTFLRSDTSIRLSIGSTSLSFPKMKLLRS